MPFWAKIPSLYLRCDYNIKSAIKIIDAVHRANTRKVKSFILSFGQSAKTDSLDAKALAYYGFERHQCLDCFTPASKHMSDLYILIQRRKDLKQMLVAEKNRAQSPKALLMKNSCQAMIAAIAEQIKNMSQQIEELISSEQTLSARKDILKTIPGIGDIIAQELLIMMPELGTMNRRQAASLAGVAPKAHESGKLKRYRRCQYGRDIIKSMLFLAAMAARCSNSPLKLFYEKLIARGKKKMVALTALMRKIIVIANAGLAQWQKEQMVENTQIPS